MSRRRIGRRRPDLGRSALVWGSVAVTVLFSYLAVRHVSFTAVGHALAATDYPLLVPALACFACAIFLRAVRWQALFPPETRPPLRAVADAMLVGYLFNNLLPARAGEAARVLTLFQRTGTSRPQSVATVLIERVYDVLSLLFLLFVALPWLPHVSWTRKAAIAAAVLAAATTAVAIVVSRYGDRPLMLALGPVLRRLPMLGPERAERAVRFAAEGLAGLRRGRLALVALVWTFASWIAMASLTGSSSRRSASICRSGPGSSSSSRRVCRPSSPRRPRASESSRPRRSWRSRAYGVPRAEALSYALVLHVVVNFLPFLVVGIPILQRHTASLRRVAAPPTAEIAA